MLGLHGYNQTILPLELQVLNPISRKGPPRRSSSDVDYTDETNQNETGKTTRKRRSLPVDVKPVDYKHTQARLEQKLENRRTKLDLVQHNIIKEEDIAPSIQAAQQKLKFNRRMNELDKRLGHRPVRSELVDLNIIKRGQTAPNLQAVQQQVRFKTTVSAIEHKFEQRPTYEQLVDKNIIRADGQTPKKLGHIADEEAIAKRMDELTVSRPDQVDVHPEDFSQSKVSLTQKLEHRPAVDTLVKQNILKGNSSVVAPSLHAKQQLLQRHLSNSKLKQTLDFKPRDVSPERHHESVGDVVSSMERRIQHN